MATCGGCAKKWHSAAWAHCSTCHETFSGVTFFDAHRDRGRCGPVEGLALQDGVWSTPEGHQKRLDFIAKIHG